ncbi:MAG: hypothetical protein WCE61_03040 [Candidatus Acidiferrum sp.]
MRHLLRGGRRYFIRRFAAGNGYLPAVTAVSTIAAASATTAAMTTAATTTASTSTVTTTTASAPAATAALSLWTRLIDHQVPPAEILAVQGIDGAIGIFVSLHFDEGKTARLPREPVTNQIDARGSYAYLCKPFLKLFFRGGKRKITDIELLHLPLLLPGTQVRVAERAEGHLIVHGQPEEPSHRGRETGASAVRGMVSKINWFCNRKDAQLLARL